MTDTELQQGDPDPPAVELRERDTSGPLPDEAGFQPDAPLPRPPASAAAPPPAPTARR